MQYSGNQPNAVGFWFFHGESIPEHTLCQVSASVDHLGVYTFYVTPFNATQPLLMSTFIDANGCDAFAGPVPVPTW